MTWQLCIYHPRWGKGQFHPYPRQLSCPLFISVFSPIQALILVTTHFTVPGCHTDRIMQNVLFSILGGFLLFVFFCFLKLIDVRISSLFLFISVWHSFTWKCFCLYFLLFVDSWIVFSFWLLCMWLLITSFFFFFFIIGT